MNCLSFLSDKFSVFKPKLQQTQLSRHFDLTCIITGYLCTIVLLPNGNHSWKLILIQMPKPIRNRICVVSIVKKLLFSGAHVWFRCMLNRIQIFFLLSFQTSDQQQRHRSPSQTRLRLFDIWAELMGAQLRDHPHYNEAQTPEEGRRLQMTYTFETFCVTFDHARESMHSIVLDSLFLLIKRRESHSSTQFPVPSLYSRLFLSFLPPCPCSIPNPLLLFFLMSPICFTL